MTNVYRMGICAASVCSDEGPEKMLEAVNAQWPAGGELRWQLSESPTFKGGEPNPSPCNQGTPGAQHYLLLC